MDSLIDLSDTHELIVKKKVFQEKDSEGGVICERLQLPLKLACKLMGSFSPLILLGGITVHKSQGMSLDKAHIDLNKSFAPGQV